ACLAADRAVASDSALGQIEGGFVADGAAVAAADVGLLHRDLPVWRSWLYERTNRRPSDNELQLIFCPITRPAPRSPQPAFKAGSRPSLSDWASFCVKSPSSRRSCVYR